KETPLLPEGGEAARSAAGWYPGTAKRSISKSVLTPTVIRSAPAARAWIPPRLASFLGSAPLLQEGGEFLTPASRTHLLRARTTQTRTHRAPPLPAAVLYRYRLNLVGGGKTKHLRIKIQFRFRRALDVFGLTESMAFRRKRNIRERQLLFPQRRNHRFRLGRRDDFIFAAL